MVNQSGQAIPPLLVLRHRPASQLPLQGEADRIPQERRVSPHPERSGSILTSTFPPVQTTQPVAICRQHGAGQLPGRHGQSVETFSGWIAVRPANTFSPVVLPVAWRADRRAGLTIYCGCPNAPQPRVNIGRFYSGPPERTQRGGECQEKCRRNRVFRPRSGAERIKLCAGWERSGQVRSLAGEGRQHAPRIIHESDGLSAEALTSCRRQRQQQPGPLRSRDRPARDGRRGWAARGDGAGRPSARRPAEPARR